MVLAPPHDVRGAGVADGGPEHPGASTMPLWSVRFTTTTQPRSEAPAFMWMLLGLATHFCSLLARRMVGPAVSVGRCSTNNVVGVAEWSRGAEVCDPPDEVVGECPEVPDGLVPLFVGVEADDPPPPADEPPPFAGPICAPLPPPAPAPAAARAGCDDPPVKCTMPKIASAITTTAPSPTASAWFGCSRA